MSEPKAEYITEAEEALGMLGKGYENAAEIHPPKTIQVIQDKGLVEYRVWGWVKISAKFISHIKRLRGAKLSIWQVLACSIDEYGKCSLTIKELCELTGYSHTEIIDSLKELDEMGYLSIDRSGKKNLYTPEFAARGIDKAPSETLVKKLDSTPVDQVESSPSIEKSRSSIKELKELKTGKPNFKELKPSDYRKIPELKTFMDATGWIPGSFVLEVVYDFVSVGLTREQITAAFSEWTSRGYNPANVKGYLTWARDGIPEDYSDNKKQTHRKANEVTPEFNTVPVRTGVPRPANVPAPKIAGVAK